jgi:hypothetical protein
MGLMRAASLQVPSPVSLLAAVAVGVASPSFADVQGVTVNCDAGETIGAALENAKPGAYLKVLGTCRESIHLTRKMEGVTLDGQGIAIIQGPPANTHPVDSSAFAVFVTGRGVTIQGFTINGGFHGVHLSGPATAVIANNTITNSGGAIHLDKGSVGQIYGNRIEKNTVFGINLIEGSYARIGFRTPPQPKLSPNVITRNDGVAIIVGRASSAWIAGNSIMENASHGILIDRNSQADVIANNIARNGGHGIAVSRNSAVVLHSNGTERSEAGNDSTGPNEGYGLFCSLGSVADGPLGKLGGLRGQVRVETGCINASNR